MVFNATYFSHILAVSFLGEGNLEKTTHQLQVNDKIYRIMLYWVQIATSGIQFHKVLIA